MKNFLKLIIHDKGFLKKNLIATQAIHKYNKKYESPHTNP